MDNINSIDPTKYLPLVRKIADRIDVKLPSHWDKEDLVGYGVLGLMESIKRFEPGKGVKFSTFASIRIRGAILDALRRDAPLSRNDWGLLQKITEKMEKLSSNYTEEVSLKKVAKELKMSESEVSNALLAFNFFSHVSLEEALGIKGPSKNLPEEEVLENEEVQLLAEAIKKLPEKERLVLTLYYYEELNLKEIAAVLDVTVSRVSQIKSKALLSLRKILGADLK